MFAELMEGLGQMEAHAAGKKVKGVREVVKEVKAPKPLSKEDIVKLRKKLRVSQSAFAVLLNISTKTVQKWEQGENQPNGKMVFVDGELYEPEEKPAVPPTANFRDRGDCHWARRCSVAETDRLPSDSHLPAPFMGHA